MAPDKNNWSKVTAKACLGADILGLEDFRNDKHMQDFAHHGGDILYVMADTLQAKDFDELGRHSFA